MSGAASEVSFHQRQLWEANRLAPAGCHLALSLGLTGRLNAAAAAQAVDDLVERYEVLRTFYPENPEEAGSPRAVVRRDFARPFLRQIRAAPLAAMKQLRALQTAAFDLCNELPFRARLFVLAPTRHILSLVLHRIAADYWSAAPLLSDLAVAYAARLAGVMPVWDGLPPRLTRLSPSTNSEEAVFVGPRLKNGSLDRTRVRLNPGLHKRLLARARAVGQPFDRVLAAAFAKAVSTHFAPSPVSMGTCVPWKDRLPNLVGLAADMMPVDRLDRLGLRERLGVPTPAVERLTFSFTLHSQQTAMPSFPGLAAVLSPLTSAFGDWDASVDLSEDYTPDGLPAGVEGIIEYNAGTLEPRRLEQAVNEFVRSLQEETGVESPARLVLPYAPPRSPLQHLLLKVWESVMGVGRISLTDSLAELGCTAAERQAVFCGIEEILSAPLPERGVVPEATVNSLSEDLLRKLPFTPQVVPVQLGNPGRLPLFFLHGDFSGGGYYTSLLGRLLGPDQPFYVLAPHGLDGSDVPETIDAMAQEMVVRLRAFSPEGPYCLAGFCNGGLIALEMAHILIAQGETVPFLAMIDTPPPAGAEDSEYAPVEYPAPPDWKNQPGTRGLWLLSRYIAPIRRYRPAVYPGVVTLIRSEESRAKQASGETIPHGWSPFAAQVDEVDIPGTHIGCVSLYSAELAKALRNSLKRPQESFATRKPDSSGEITFASH